MEMTIMGAVMGMRIMETAKIYGNNRNGNNWNGNNGYGKNGNSNNGNGNN